MDALQKLLGPDADAMLLGLGVGKLGDEEKTVILGELVQHFQKIMMETVILNLSDEQLVEFTAAVEGDPSKMEETVERITAQVPGLAEKIEEALANEFEVLKAARAQLN